jgi:two-component system CheB/CheR fusion protein
MKLQMLRDRATDEASSESMSNLIDELTVVQRLIGDIIDATRANTGKVQLQLRREDLRRVIQAALSSCRSQIDSRTQVVHVFMPDVPLYVNIDDARMRQVFVNLIQNSAKFTRHGGSIWIKVASEANEAVVKIEDNGIGIRPDVLPSIFDLFVQAEFTDERAEGSLGIGLSVVRDLTTMHGGTVQVRSDGVGKGAEFVVRLPLARGEQTEV